VCGFVDRGPRAQADKIQAEVVSRPAAACRSGSNFAPSTSAQVLLRCLWCSRGRPVIPLGWGDSPLRSSSAETLTQHENARREAPLGDPEEQLPCRRSCSRKNSSFPTAGRNTNHGPTKERKEISCPTTFTFLDDPLMADSASAPIIRG
jgi:hypothetical protein